MLRWARECDAKEQLEGEREEEVEKKTQEQKVMRESGKGEREREAALLSRFFWGEKKISSGKMFIFCGICFHLMRGILLGPCL